MSVHLGLGRVLERGHSLTTVGSRLELALQGDGNLVLSHDGDAVWDLWATAGQVDGEVVTVEPTMLSVRGADGAILWQAGAAVNPYPRELVLRDDGQLVYQALVALWTTDTVDRNAAADDEPAVMVAGGALPPNEALQVGPYEARVTAEGQLEVRHSNVTVWSSEIKTPMSGSYLAVETPNWADVTPGQGACVKSDSGVPTWRALVPLNEIVKSTDRIELRLQADGNLVLYACQELWRATGVPDLPAARLRALLKGAVSDRTLSDGSAAVASLAPLGDDDDRPIDARRPLVLVVCAAELTEPRNGVNLIADLRRYRDDLNADGFDARIVIAQLYRGMLHEDGRILLALRSAFSSVATAHPYLTGVVLVGSFPEATVVRRWLWEVDYTTPQVRANVPAGQRYVQCWPEPVANWSDAVLADLTGRWDELYNDSVRLEAFKGIASRPPAYEDGEVIDFMPGDFILQNLTFNDVFLVIEDESGLTVDPQRGNAQLTCRTSRRNPEVFEPNLTQLNPIARPDIIVSRIDATGAAYSVNPALKDSAGNGYVDANGRPQAVLEDIENSPTTTAEQLVPDRDLELRLLSAYFDRNHEHRAGDHALHPTRDRVLSISSTDFSGVAAQHAQEVGTAVGTLEDPAVGEDTGLFGYAVSWDEPASMRVIHAHSSPVNSAFPGAYDPPTLEKYIKGPLYRWHHDKPNQRYVPGIKGQGEYADFWLHRSLWQSRARAKTASILVHYGCDTPNSTNSASKPYSDPQFAACRLASCLVFYTDVLAMFGRTKVYYDTPWSFLAPLHGGGTVGDAWMQLFSEASASERLNEFPHWVDAKIAYSWVLLGDWTIRRRYGG
ncbi:hypothetical protein [uncultured Microbacterium sp.]|uniref:Bulb-type lectin domain-containing protein n=1 Tax=uncultured Microbacterium sp. TaxID=191216 RepID=A0A1Y5P2U3_9MICO|nr:hypothetical protein [uncultured Microbacterium sp.]SBS73024.1 hypothetical protein MIPYR_30360 [uncultured Microbacterium sp.]